MHCIIALSYTGHGGHRGVVDGCRTDYKREESDSLPSMLRRCNFCVTAPNTCDALHIQHSCN